MLILERTRTQLRSALELAEQGDTAATRFTQRYLPCCCALRVPILFMADRTVRLKLFDENEEILLHVFGGTLPLCYDLGVYAPYEMAPPLLRTAVSQVEQLLKVYQFTKLHHSSHQPEGRCCVAKCHAAFIHCLSAVSIAAVLMHKMLEFLDVSIDPRSSCQVWLCA